MSPTPQAGQSEVPVAPVGRAHWGCRKRHQENDGAGRGGEGVRVNHQDQDQARGKAAPERAVHTSRANQWVPGQGPAAASFHSAHLLPRPRISPATKQNITSLTFPLTRSPLDDPGVSVLTTAGCYMGPLTQ